MLRIRLVKEAVRSHLVTGVQFFREAKQQRTLTAPSLLRLAAAGPSKRRR